MLEIKEPDPSMGKLQDIYKSHKFYNMQNYVYDVYVHVNMLWGGVLYSHQS